jgi:hypothetical protein
MRPYLKKKPLQRRVGGVAPVQQKKKKKKGMSQLSQLRVEETRMVFLYQILIRHYLGIALCGSGEEDINSVAFLACLQAECALQPI